MRRRYFSETPIVAPTIELSGQQAQHLVKVMRAKPGDEVTLFDGTGFEFAAEVTAVGRASVELKIGERSEVNRELPFQLTLAVALPKGDRQRWLVEKAVELGCQRLLPLRTARGVAQPTGNALARLERAVIEACKQCGRNHLMEIARPQQLAEVLTSTDQSKTRLLAHPDDDSLVEPVCNPDNDTVVAVGPEGGFAPEELALADAERWSRMTLGPRILRTETAAVACIVLLSHG